MPIRVEPGTSARALALPQSVELALRAFLKKDPGEDAITKAALQEIELDLQATGQGLDGKDGNEDEIGQIGDTAVMADGDVVLKVLIEGLRRRLACPVIDGEVFRFTGGRA
jgi:hypothetical protein